MLMVRWAMMMPAQLLSSPVIRNSVYIGSTRITGGSIWLASTNSRSGSPPVAKRAKA